MFKTIITIPNWIAIPGGAYQQIMLYIAQATNQGKYSGQELQEVDQNGTKTVQRWDWTDEATAQGYFDVSQAATAGQFPGITYQIVPN